MTRGRLPDGLSLDARSGIISGIPTASGARSFTVTLVNSHGRILRLERTIGVLSGAGTAASPIGGSTFGGLTRVVAIAVTILILSTVLVAAIALLVNLLG